MKSTYRSQALVLAIMACTSGFNPAHAEDAKIDKVLANQQTILANQKKILDNQGTIVANQGKILGNQTSILNNQKKLDQILANQEECKKEKGKKK